MPIEPKAGINIHLVALGTIGKSSNAHEKEVNSNIESFIPELETYLADGKLKPMEYEVVGGIGVGEVLTALEAFNTRKSSDKKIVVRIAVE
jgi:hypothetical protein